MQKKLIVLALAGLASSAAFAQTNVTIYGVIDEYVGYGSAANDKLINPLTGLPIANTGGDQKFYGLQSGGLSGSRLGFKGEEALGNGLKAIFVYEFGSLDPSSSSNGIGSTRQSYVGLTGGWGTFIGGKLQSPGYDNALKFDTMGASVFSPQLLMSTNAGMTIQGSSQGRIPNTIAYVSPNFSGFTGEIIYSFGEQVTGSNVLTTALNPVYDKAQSIWGASLNYDNGPLAVGLAYHGIDNAGGTLNTIPSSNNKKQTEYELGASYDFKMVKLFGSYQYIKQEGFLSLGNGVTVLTPRDNTSGNLWNIGVSVPVGANGAVKLAYSYYDNSVPNFFFGSRNNDQKSQSLGIDYEYSLSKRTTAYAGGNYISNGSNTNYGYPASGVSVIPSFDNNAWMVGAGVRHTF